MKTLVVHPNDESTDFLSCIYNEKDWTVIRNGKISKTELIENIKTHDRIIMLGHGTPHGLIGVFDERLIINPNLVYLLRDKYCVGIWCNADVFFEKYNLKGIYTGMIISETQEALDNDVLPINNSVDESNKSFALAMKDFIDGNISLNEVKNIYKDEKNPVISFNRERIFETK